MKTTWKTTIEGMAITVLCWRIESADVECDVCITPGEPDTRDCPGSDPVCEIYGIRVVAADKVSMITGRHSRLIDSGQSSDLIDRGIRQHLLDSGWNHQPEVLARCLQEVSEEMKDADDMAREMAAESRRER